MAPSGSGQALQVELVAADRVVWSGEAARVLARTASGDLGVLANHAPLLSLLVPGVVEIETTGGERVRAAVGDGFLSVSDNRVSILSEDTFLAEEIVESDARAELERAAADGDDLAALRAEAKLRVLQRS
ncbi:MAG: F0F1 ATP synthase subunit epsilon [Aeromicrobium sp.]|uniref:F0F1 ATP synthase subunit epsilon n=1 Tax=Aeromicrobium sp. TaxID=1871063 RepID=UPI0026136381|nr:F0F1 ATP synthase subunit epsilon [Aeromicrobium sp.]MDF1704089.1 F0F1 ATP synthase subunit epsilon [Aeromicrobium sp.]